MFCITPAFQLESHKGYPLRQKDVADITQLCEAFQLTLPEHINLLVFIGQKLVGVGLSVDDIVDDIWLSAGARGIGIGSEMLGRLEQQIVDRGFQTAQLRVLEENNRARRFYENHGWIAAHSYQHERLGVNMVSYSKTLPDRS